MAQIDTPQYVSRVFDTFWGTFFGAAVALLLLPITSTISKLVQRKVKHYNSLVLLEGQLNEMLGELKDNIYLIPNFQSAIKNGNICWNAIRTIKIDKNHLVNLSDLDLINNIASFFVGLRKLNDDIENLSRGYDEIKNAYIQKLISVSHYVINANQLAIELQTLSDYMEMLYDEVIDLLAKVRLTMQKDKPYIVRLQNLISRNSSEKITLKQFNGEVNKLKLEIDNTVKSSGEKIKILTKKRQK